ncbi:MAG: hypothetical protein IKO32_11075 [Lachnospiraceae bacterium]|nr:hypothetical protein [Lachnospiraceae bacterium]
MSEENTNNTNNTNGEESLSGEWKSVGKGLGKTFTGLGKTLIKTAKVGIEKADDWAEDREGVDRSAEVEDIKAGWKAFGGDFVDSAQDVGKTTVKSVKAGAQAVSGDDDSSSQGSDANS